MKTIMLLSLIGLSLTACGDLNGTQYRKAKDKAGVMAAECEVSGQFSCFSGRIPENDYYVDGKVVVKDHKNLREMIESRFEAVYKASAKAIKPLNGDQDFTDGFVGYMRNDRERYREFAHSGVIKFNHLPPGNYTFVLARFFDYEIEFKPSANRTFTNERFCAQLTASRDIFLPEGVKLDKLPQGLYFDLTLWERPCPAGPREMDSFL